MHRLRKYKKIIIAMGTLLGFSALFTIATIVVALLAFPSLMNDNIRVRNQLRDYEAAAEQKTFYEAYVGKYRLKNDSDFTLVLQENHACSAEYQSSGYSRECHWVIDDTGLGAVIYVNDGTYRAVPLLIKEVGKIQYDGVTYKFIER